MMPIKMMPIKIAIIGKMCSGKTTLSDALIRRFEEEKGIKIEKDFFARRVYELAYSLFDMKTKNRELLQKIGTKMREIDLNVWVNCVVRNARDKNILVEDCRYKNEFQALKDEGFLMVKLHLSPELQLERLKRTYPETWEEHLRNLHHPSETDLDDYDESYFDINLQANEIETNLETLYQFVLQNYHL